MPTSKRAWLYVTRSRKRTVLLFLLFTVLMTVSLCGFALHAASRKAVAELRSSIGGYFTIHTGAEGTERADQALLDQVKTLDNIRAFNGLDTYYLYAEGLSLMPGSWYGSGTVNENTPKFIGCTESALHERFLTSSFQLEEGSPITEGDLHKALISREVAVMNNLSVGDTLRAGAAEGLRDWPMNGENTSVVFQIAGIYVPTRKEPASPFKPEWDLQENMIFTDIQTAKEIAAVKFPQRAAEEYVYSSGIMLFLQDPAQMEETIALLRQQDYAGWDGLLIYENSAAYQQAVAPIQKVSTISLFLLLVILVISVAILSLTLLLWTRERTREFGILISMGIPAKGLCGQLLLENYMVAFPAFVVSLALSAILSDGLGSLFGDTLARVQLHPMQALAVLVCAAGVILLTVLLASVSIPRRKPREILIVLS